MALNINHSRCFAMASELEALVRSVEAADHSDESEWLEWKSQLDLSAKAGQFAVARAVIGMANCDPQIAGRFAEGHGYVIVGAEPGNLAGVPAIESHVLESRLAPYVGTDGPRWTSQNVSVDGTNVLVVTVLPRPNGDRFYWLERSYHSPNGKETASSGIVFVRRKSSTERANSSEMANLVNGMRSPSGNPLLDVKIEIAEGPHVPTLTWSQEDVDDWLRRRRQELLVSLEHHQQREERPTTSPLVTSDLQKTLMAAALSSLRPEKRMPEDYVRQVEDHLQTCKIRLKAAALASYARQKLGRVDFILTNPTEIGFRDVLIEVHLSRCGIHIQELCRQPGAASNEAKALRERPSDD